MATKILSWLAVFTVIGLCGCQKNNTNLRIPRSFDHHGICKSMFCNTIEALSRLKNCTVILGNLHVVVLERTKRDDFENVSFPQLKEITGFLLVYRVRGLESLGQLFPNLIRIRGNHLFYNYALIIHDMPNLREIGLYNLLKIDRGGVIVWGATQACWIDTVDWQAIAPGYRHVLDVDKHAQCDIACRCSRNPVTNRCWNIKKCQRFLDGPEGEKCKSQCLGCRKTNSSDCSVCRHYTFRGQCVSDCPNGTVVLPANSYCLPDEECVKIGGWSWNNTCVFECPLNYVKVNISNISTCEFCKNCTEVCGSQLIKNLETIQLAGRCIYINGSLTIHVSSIPEAVTELRLYLSELKEVFEYILIYGSVQMTSLDFMPSLRRIRGQKLESGRFSLVVYNMPNLQSLFIGNVTQNLKVDNGTVNFYGNPMLCMRHIEELLKVFPTQPNEIDLLQGMNGYSGGCQEISLELRVVVINETSALVRFLPISDPFVQYTILYVLLPPGNSTKFVPESCSESEWFVLDVPTVSNQLVEIQLTSLHPASNYAICVETYDPVHRNLARSSILSFQTHIGKPQPPFILELVASSSQNVVIRWVDHKDYKSHIVRYELDVNLIEIRSKDIAARDHCKHKDEDYDELDYSRHAVVSRPPPNYDKGCKSMCGVLSSVTEGALIEEHFDICSSYTLDCDSENIIRKNETYGKYIKSSSININRPGNVYQVGGLAPFRDYKFNLRACTDSHCSRSARNVVRTLRKKDADIPIITFSDANSDGFITVHWNPPIETNGPILSYNIEVLPKLSSNDINYLIPQSWCTSRNKTSLTVKSELAKKYIVRVCTTTLGSSKSCSEWKKTLVTVTTKKVPTWWWSGIFYGVLLYFISTAFGWFFNKRRGNTDRMLLIDNGLNYANETDPPSFMMRDLAPSYSIPLRDTPLD
ncbi:PREDICTED: insulin-like peptide receptor [Papilio polytes]|uniref:insulin-like peptide receptor n=1 Tax=Papilio polytes TaxID=76194 RepID=UPI0006765D39|nr:PREDICTED: insulin-like peptide receptor [Papilio polytes]XP_013145760.1 PREDICTED: insulin-like peptide receptor [Papilio polytes]